MSNNCKMCGNCCKVYPCGLRPDELKPIADCLKISVKDLIDTYLIQDYFVGDNEDIYYLCCKRQGDTDTIASFEWAFIPIPCIFLTKDNLCQIHEVKPHQGRNGMPCQAHDINASECKRQLAELWQPFDEKLEQLYEQ